MTPQPQPPPAFPVPYMPQTPSPMARIVNTLGLCTIIFGAASAMVGVTSFLTYVKTPYPNGQQIILAATATRGLFGVVLVIAGVLLLQQSSSYPLVLVGSIGTIAAGFVESAAYIARYMNVTAASPSSSMSLFLFNRLLYFAVYAMFPLAIMLVLPHCRNSDYR